METKPKRKKKEKKLNPVSKLIESLKFLNPVKSTHCMLAKGWVVASDDLLTIGVRIDEDFLQAYPQRKLLIEALSNAGDNLAITQISTTGISVSSGGFKVVVDCLELMTIGGPDNPVALINDDVGESLRQVLPLLTEKSETPHSTYALLEKNFAASTDFIGVLESFHGNDLPMGMLIPKKAVLAIAKCKKLMTGFGYSGETCTFWYEDESFIKVKLVQGEFAKYKKAFREGLNYTKVDDTFFKALNYMKSFAEDDEVYFGEGELICKDKFGNNSTTVTSALPKGMIFNLKFLLKLKNVFKNAYFDVKGNKVYFYNEKTKTRGVLAGIAKPEKEDE